MTDEEKIDAVTAKLLFPPGTWVNAWLRERGGYAKREPGVVAGMDVLLDRLRVKMHSGEIWFPLITQVERRD